MANIKDYDLQSSRYKRGYLVIIRDNFCQFCTKTYVVTPHVNCLETVQMRGHNIWFQREIKNYPSVITENSSYLELWISLCQTCIVLHFSHEIYMNL